MDQIASSFSLDLQYQIQPLSCDLDSQSSMGRHLTEITIKVMGGIVVSKTQLEEILMLILLIIELLCKVTKR